MRSYSGVLSVLLMLLLAACQLDLPPVTQGRTTPLDAPFTLRANQSIAIAGEDATLRLEPWAEDKRCPAETECAESGPVRIQVTLWRDGRPTTYPVFVAHTDPTGAVLPDAPGSDLTAKVGPLRDHAHRRHALSHRGDAAGDGRVCRHFRRQQGLGRQPRHRCRHARDDRCSLHPGAGRAGDHDRRQHYAHGGNSD
jgi:hypothetical protein